MIASEIVSTDIFPLKKTDTIESALVFMRNWRVFNLPVVEGKELLGYVSFEELSELPLRQKIEKHVRPQTQLFVAESQHFFEVIGLFSTSNYTCLAVCNQQNEYIGSIGFTEVNNAFKLSSLAQPGAIVVLKMSANDYSLAELSRIIEYNDCKIINVFIDVDKIDPTKLFVSLKLNKQSITNVIQTLERYQYNIFALHQLLEQNPDLNNRYDWLVKYLNT